MNIEKMKEDLKALDKQFNHLWDMADIAESEGDYTLAESRVRRARDIDDLRQEIYVKLNP